MYDIWISISPHPSPSRNEPLNLATRPTTTTETQRTQGPPPWFAVCFFFFICPAPWVLLCIRGRRSRQHLTVKIYTFCPITHRNHKPGGHHGERQDG